jgi:hypothetical protein
MEVAQLVLEYLKVLAWPVLAGVALLAFRKPVYQFLEGLDELTFSNVGVRRRNDKRAVAVHKEVELLTEPDATLAEAELDSTMDQRPEQVPEQDQEEAKAPSAMHRDRLLQLEYDIPVEMKQSRARAQNSWELTRFAGQVFQSVVIDVARSAGLEDVDLEFGWGAPLRQIGVPNTFVNMAKDLYDLYVDVTIEGNVRQIGEDGADSFAKTAEHVAKLLVSWALHRNARVGAR